MEAGVQIQYQVYISHMKVYLNFVSLLLYHKMVLGLMWQTTCALHLTSTLYSTLLTEPPIDHL